MFGVKLVVSLVLGTVILMFGSIQGQGGFDYETNGVGCNNVDAVYTVDYCYGGALTSDIGGFESVMFDCVSSYRLARYIYNSTDCSGDIIETEYYGFNSTDTRYFDKDFQCNTSTNCDFATIDEFFDDDDCDISSRYATAEAYLVGVCAPVTFDEGSGYDSYYGLCQTDETDFAIRILLYDNDDCSDSTSVINYYVEGTSSYPRAVYCPGDDGYGECNNSGAIENYHFFKNTFFISCLIQTLYFVIF